jgi:hypothetical protein
MKKLMKEPLLHFLLIGAVLFGISWMMNNKTDEEASGEQPIIITNATLEKIRSNYEQHSGSTPSRVLMAELVSKYIRQEVLYKEALKAGLDQNNDSLKTLLAAQMNTAYQLAFDSDKIPDPTDEQLVQYLRAHQNEFAIDMPIDDTIIAVQTFLKTKLRFKYFQSEKQKHFEEKMKAIEAQYKVIRKDSLQPKAA